MSGRERRREGGERVGKGRERKGGERRVEKREGRRKGTPGRTHPLKILATPLRKQSARFVLLRK